VTTNDISLVAILGMHRCGTSCLAGSLEERGLHLDQVFEWSPHNLKGNRENAEVMTLNEAVLEQSGGSWDRPPAAITWTAEQAERRDGIIARCTHGFTTTWGFKDPRSVFTLPFWQNAAKPMKYVGTFRHPLLAARSLEARNGMPLADGLAMWVAYNRRLLDHCRLQPFPIVSFDVPADEYLQAVEQLGDHLGLPRAAAPGTAQFLEDRLRHQDPDAAVALPAEVEVLYAELSAAYKALRDSRA
jgi:hypothetical protein